METLVRASAADVVWIAASLLHRENASTEEFSVPEIRDRALGIDLWAGDPRTIYQHVLQHCVANRPPNNSKLRMLIDTRPGEDRPGYRRLFRDGDICDPARVGDNFGTRITPRREDLPEEYLSLLSWYEEWSKQNNSRQHPLEKLLALRGSGRHIWADEHADEYVARLREGWE